jgi:hypothetical protein
MGKIVNGEQRQYLDRTKVYRSAIDGLLKREQTLLQDIRADSSSEGGALKRLDLVRDMLDAASNYIILNNLSQAMMRTKNMEALEEGRKALYKSLMYLEEVLGRQIDVPYSDYEDLLAKIHQLKAADRYLLIRKMGLAVQLLENAFGDNSRWRWAFVELEGRFAAAAKNILDLRAAFNNTDPQAADYEPVMRHLRLVKRLLTQAADRYRERYELSTNSIDDFKQGLLFLAALRRIHTLLGERERVEVIKKKLDVWSAKLAEDQRKQTQLSLLPSQQGKATPKED